MGKLIVSLVAVSLWASYSSAGCKGQKVVEGQVIQEGQEFVIVSEARTNQIFFDLGTVAENPELAACAEKGCKARVDITIVEKEKASLLNRYKATFNKFVKELQLFHSAAKLNECSRSSDT